MIVIFMLKPKTLLKLRHDLWNIISIGKPYFVLEIFFLLKYANIEFHLSQIIQSFLLHDVVFGSFVIFRNSTSRFLTRTTREFWYGTYHLINRGNWENKVNKDCIMDIGQTTKTVAIFLCVVCIYVV